MDSNTGFRLGHRIAPPRFLLFLALFALGTAAAVPALGWAQAVMAGFDLAALVFFLAITGLFRQGEAEQMRQASRDNDANRVLLLVVSALVTLVILVAVGAVVKQQGSPLTDALVIATLVLTWLFSNVIYALHYAHLYYSEKDGADRGGMLFPECDEPDYWDFLYFSMTMGMAFATSDTKITSGRVRRVATGQTFAAFVFNLGVLAFTVGVLGGGVGS